MDIFLIFKFIINQYILKHLQIWCLRDLTEELIQIQEQTQLVQQIQTFREVFQTQFSRSLLLAKSLVLEAVVTVQQMMIF